MREYFQLLGVSQNATPDQLARAYHQQLAAWDPLRFPHNERLRRTAERKTQELKIAFRHLEARTRSSGGRSKHPAENSDSAINFSSYDYPGPIVVRPRERSNTGAKPPTGMRLTALKEFITALTYTACLVVLVAICMTVTIDLGALVKNGGVAARSVALTSLSGNAEAPPSFSTSSLIFAPAVIAASGTGVMKVSAISELPSDQQSLAQKISSGERPALIHAAMQCDVRTARRLINGGADVNIQDVTGDSALTWAAKVNCPAIAKLLMERGANPVHVSNNGFTPPQWAAWYKNFEVQRVFDRPFY